MGLMTTLALVAAPTVTRPSREAQLEKRIRALKAERDQWRAECLAAHRQLTEAALEQVRLRDVIAILAPVEWTVPNCTPDRATALKGDAR